MAKKNYYLCDEIERDLLKAETFCKCRKVLDWILVLGLGAAFLSLEFSFLLYLEFMMASPEELELFICKEPDWYKMYLLIEPYFRGKGIWFCGFGAIGILLMINIIGSILTAVLVERESYRRHITAVSTEGELVCILRTKQRQFYNDKCLKRKVPLVLSFFSVYSFLVVAFFWDFTFDASEMDMFNIVYCFVIGGVLFGFLLFPVMRCIFHFIRLSFIRSLHDLGNKESKRYKTLRCELEDSFKKLCPEEFRAEQEERERIRREREREEQEKEEEFRKKWNELLVRDHLDDLKELNKSRTRDSLDDYALDIAVRHMRGEDTIPSGLEDYDSHLSDM